MAEHPSLWANLNLYFSFGLGNPWDEPQLVERADVDRLLQVVSVII